MTDSTSTESSRVLFHFEDIFCFGWDQGCWGRRCGFAAQSFLQLGGSSAMRVARLAPSLHGGDIGVVEWID